MESGVRVRFAPSPTGYLHVGGLRTALFNYLFARHHHGAFILRIEDTDQNRYQPEVLEEIYQSLEWLGLEWDEGPKKGGEYGPYFQSQRTDLYKKCANELLERNTAYPCFCSPERLARLREQQEKTHAEITGYDRLCRNISREERERRIAAGEPYVIRLKIPEGAAIRFHDLIRGAIEYLPEALDDTVLLKSDGFPTYHLANVVDDHFMKITHVMRGEEWIASTPRHCILYNAFGWTPPLFAHLPLILSQEGGKLSKRKGAASVMDYKNAGFPPEALLNFLALLGWAPGDNREIMTGRELIEAFSLEHISPKASVFDEKKLEWMSGHYLQQQSAASLFDEVFSSLQRKGYPVHEKDREYVIRVIDLLKIRSKRITEIADQASYFFTDPDTYEEKSAKKYFSAQSRTLLVTIRDTIQTAEPFSAASLETAFRQLAEVSAISAGKLIHPTRLAVTGVSHGPGLFELMEVLGREVCHRRLDKAIQWMDTHDEENAK